MHVNFVFSQCSQRLYLLKLLRSQGLSTAQLDQVSQAIIVSRLRYALPVWSGFLTADLINRIQALLKRLFKFGYSSHLISFSDLMKSCSEDLFENAHKSNDCLHELFSSYVHRLESLCPRGHDLMLPACTGYLHKQSFIIWSLFEFFFSFFYITSVSFLVPLFRVCAFVTFFNKILCVLLCCALSYAIISYCYAFIIILSSFIIILSSYSMREILLHFHFLFQICVHSYFL